MDRTSHVVGSRSIKWLYNLGNGGLVGGVRKGRVETKEKIGMET